MLSPSRSVALLIGICFSAALPLLLGLESVLLIDIAGGLPLGNLMAAIALISGNGACVISSSADTVRYLISLLSLLCATLWLPLGIYLSGNTALNFAGENGVSYGYWAFTAALIALLVLLVIWGLLSLAMKKFRGPRAP